MGARTPDYQSGQLIPGTVYRVHRVLGAGGMGTVYDVEDTTVGRRYVLKTLHGDLADRADLAARLAREARALAKLQHPNIVEVYTSGTTQDKLKLPFYVMERLQGQSLRTAIERKGRLTLEQAYDIAIDLLDALDHAHEFGIVHRDVKPDNIFITRGRDGRSLAKLLDFGIIKLSGSSTMHTGGRFIGTFRYAPPEQILGREVTGQSDLYAAALVLYEMIAGRGPFDDFAGEVEIGKAHIELPPPPVSRFAQVPPELDALILSALDKKAENRPKDAFTFASAIRELKRKLSSRIGDVGQQPTAAEVVSQVAPSSGSVAQVGSSARINVTPSGSGETRVDSPGAMLGPTQASPRHATVDYGAAPEPLFSTQASASPPVMTQGPSSAPVALVRPAPVDRNAETREAAPAPRFVPSNDTSPIPRVVPAELVAEEPPRVVETFGAHTSNPIAKPGGRTAPAFLIAGAAVLAVSLGILGLAVWKHSHPLSTATALPPPLVTLATATATPTPAETSVPSAAASVEVPVAPAPAMPSAKVAATASTATSRPSATAKSTSVAGTSSHVAAPPPSASTPTHRPGSGL